MHGQDGKRQINHSEKGQSVLEWAEVKSLKKIGTELLFHKKNYLGEDQSHPLSCCFYVGHNELWLNACMEWCRAVGRRPTLKKCNGKIVPSSQSSYFLSSAFHRWVASSAATLFHILKQPSVTAVWWPGGMQPLRKSWKYIKLPVRCSVHADLLCHEGLSCKLGF